VSEPRIHVPDRSLGEPKPAKRGPDKPRESYCGRFVIRLTVYASSPAVLWRKARQCEQLLRELAPHGTSVQPVELVVQRGKKGNEFRLIMREAAKAPEARPAPRPAIVREDPRWQRPLIGQHGYLTYLESAGQVLTGREILEQSLVHCYVRDSILQWREERRPA
jgi:hypothetical protein